MKNKNRLINYLLDEKGLDVTERYLLAFRLRRSRSKTRAKKQCVLNARVPIEFMGVSLGFRTLARFYVQKGKRRKFWEGLK